MGRLNLSSIAGNQPVSWAPAAISAAAVEEGGTLRNWVFEIDHSSHAQPKPFWICISLPTVSKWNPFKRQTMLATASKL